MKKLLCLVLSLSMVLSLLPVSADAAFKASASAQKLEVNGEAVTCEKYNIDGSNYFKLRDIAQLLDGTKSQFEVGWDNATQTISITTGSTYTAVGGELTVRGDLSKQTKVSNQVLMIDGQKVTSLSVYNIGGNNFFKLRDLGDALGFVVDYDAASNTAIVESAGTAVQMSNATRVEIMGLPKGYAYIENPTTRTDFLHNAIYAMATGNYDFNYAGTLVNEAYEFDTIKYSLGGIFSVYDNQPPFQIVSVDGFYRLSYGGDEVLSKAQIGKNSDAAVAAAKGIYKKLHASGQVASGMSQKQIAMAYSDYLYSTGVSGTDSWSKGAYNAETMAYDTAYACLVNKKADCAGRAAAFELLMHIEGIPCTSIFGAISNSTTSHVLNYLILDGQEYYSDWFNRNTYLTDTYKKNTPAWENKDALSPCFAPINSFDKTFTPGSNDDFNYLDCARALAKAYQSGSIKEFDKALIAYATTWFGDSPFTLLDYYYTDNLTQSFNCEGNADVEYIGSGQFKLTPKNGKIVYNEKDYNPIKRSYFFQMKPIDGKESGFSGNIIGGSVVVFDHGSIIINIAHNKARILNWNKQEFPKSEINTYLTEGFEITFIAGSGTYHAVCTTK